MICERHILDRYRSCYPLSWRTDPKRAIAIDQLRSSSFTIGERNIKLFKARCISPGKIAKTVFLIALRQE